MIPLTQEYVDSCPVERGFRLRGMDMTRTEVFVDAAFAFAVTMLVISFDAIPQNWEEIIFAIKSIPAFAVAVAQLVWIWYEHSVWSKRYGMDDAMTVLLSAVLLIVMLVWIYPMRIMFGGMFRWFSGGYLPSGFEVETVAQLSGMFVFLGTGFAALCAVFVALYRYAERRRAELRLSEMELFTTRTVMVIWAGFGAIGLLSVLAALVLPGRWAPFAGLVYFLMGVWGGWYPTRREKLKKSLFPDPA